MSRSGQMPGWFVPVLGIAAVLVIASGSAAGKFGGPPLPPIEPPKMKDPKKRGVQGLWGA